MTSCPYCGTTYESTYPPIMLSRQQQLIYDHVANAGPRGSPVRSLLSIVYGDEPPKTAGGALRVNVFEINRKIKERGQRIRGRKGAGYVLVVDNSK